MGLLDRLFGRTDEPRASAPGIGSQQPRASADEQALQRYRYMLRTAPPETIEQAHEEAFAKLTPEQRAEVLRDLAEVTPPEERAGVGAGQTDPKSLARLATRAEMREPGVMERTFSRGGMGMGGMGMGGMMAGTIFGSLVAGFVGSMIAQQFFDSIGDAGFSDAALGGQAAAEQPVDSGDGGFMDTGGDFGGDFGGDI